MNKMSDVEAKKWAQLGLAVSKVPLYLSPAFLIAGVMSLGAGDGGLHQCVESGFGVFLCISMAYPLLYIAVAMAAAYSHKQGRLVSAVTFSWLAAVTFVMALLNSGLL